MSEPQVTITLGRTGRKVIKRPQASARIDSQPLSGRKRFTREGFGSTADGSGFSTAKRLRGNGSTRNPDARIRGNDLRLKLTRKRMSRQNQREVEERKNLELRDFRQNISRTSQASEGQERNFVRQVPLEKRAGGMLMMDPLRSYSSMSLNRLRAEHTDRVPESSRRLSPPRDNYEMRGVPSTKPIDVSGTGRLLNSDLMGPSRTKGCADITMRGTFNADSYKPVRTELLPASGGMLKSSYLVQI